MKLRSLFLLLAVACTASAQTQNVVTFAPSDGAFPLAATPIVVEVSAPEAVRTVAAAFASDLEQVVSHQQIVLNALPKSRPGLILVGVLGFSPLLDQLVQAHKLDVNAIRGQWECALTTVVDHPFPGVARALVIAGSDRRGAAFALFALSRQMGVSPWTWWADVPIPRHAAVYVVANNVVQPSPSVQYRGIFLNDEDWGLRPWAAKVMDPEVRNIGPHTYERVFELLLRLHANTLWPAMHPGSLAFNALPGNANLADKWGIVMGSSHSEALLRNNVGEWDEKRDGPWNYQKNAPAMQSYWDKRLAENGKFENFYTVGLRGVHDSGLEATGSPQVKAKLVEDVMTDQRKLLAKYISPDLPKVPQVIWLYKESLDLYRVGMKIPEDVTLGWTDDNYGYIRQLPNAEEQKRAGGSGVYYHVSYWGSPHDYLWLCTTPPALIKEEMTKAYDHGARKYWILNVGDLKPAELDIDYFLQLAADEPRMAAQQPADFLAQWSAEQFPTADSHKIADLLSQYYALNFIRKPEFMGFNGYNDGINRTAFNPLAWGNQNTDRRFAWDQLSAETQSLVSSVLSERSAFFELVEYPIVTAAAMNNKLLFADNTFLDAAQQRDSSHDAERSIAAYDTIRNLTDKYGYLPWSGMMSSSPRDRQVFRMPVLATAADADKPLPPTWAAGDESSVVSRNAASFTRQQGSPSAQWHVLDLGISGKSVVFGQPGIPADQGHASLDYDLTTKAIASATLALHFLPTFAVDSSHRLRYAISLDGQPATELDLLTNGATTRDWATNVLRNDAVVTLPLGPLTAGRHTVRFFYRDPGVILQHLVIAPPDAPPAYPVPPVTP